MIWKRMSTSISPSTSTSLFRPIQTLIQTVPPVQCSVNDLNGVTENNQIKHELRK